ncbi:MAG: bifunctional glutamate N-acetyltransferase/amino-acid acetyltransferase ArgJ [Gammaproteobacteria bacterium]|nr:bifunctional glutamate N-acetyltransferase/amino-acid acetyltransferase ArgJ [Gammaproteobacteria bacterium]
MAVGLRPPQDLLPVPGVTLAACSAGIYRKPRPDLCLMAFAPGSRAAAVFTRNAFCAAPVQVARSHIAGASPRYGLINAGNANAGTGQRGIDDAVAVCRAAASLGGCLETEVLPFSTGVIGEFLPVDSIRKALPALHGRLSASGWIECAQAIMTTDTIAKGVSRRVEIQGRPVTVTGIAKGAGMIHPRMATLLAFIATDATLDKAVLHELLGDAVRGSFNRISVDGDTSTNDAVLLVATGKSGVPAGAAGSTPDVQAVQAAVSAVCVELAQAVIRDAEGATKFISIRVEQGASEAECVRVAEAIAGSLLVKTAFYASDPNWGRILAAVGRAGVEGLDTSKVGIDLADVRIVEHGARAAAYTERAGKEIMSHAEIPLRIRLGRGSYAATIWTCDLSHDYVKINAEYRS